MRQSELFSKTRREAPKDETSKNAEILIRAGFIHKELSGVYSLLPLGLLVVKKIKKIISEEMEALGSLEVSMTSLQEKETWEKTNRWDDDKVDIWFKTKLKNGNEVGLAWSHEEPIVEMLKSFVSSYKDLPVKVHQFQNKLRNELRAKAGIMRCREFLMKDMYCLAKSEDENLDFYNKVIESYKNVFSRIGIGDVTYITSASGGVFTQSFSHEFQTVCEAGEDVIYINEEKKIAINEEIFNTETLSKLGLNEKDFEKKKAAEVGNIFNFGNKKSEEMDLQFTDALGKRQYPFLSSYGIGVTRLLGVLAEINSHDGKMLWPEAVSPFKYNLIAIYSDNEENNKKVRETCEIVYGTLGKEDCLFDDREIRPGEKFSDSDLLGLPFEIIVSEKSLDQNKIEYKNRRTAETKLISFEDLNTL